MLGKDRGLGKKRRKAEGNHQRIGSVLRDNTASLGDERESCRKV